jgi:hypothetical protein
MVNGKRKVPLCVSGLNGGLRIEGAVQAQNGTKLEMNRWASIIVKKIEFSKLLSSVGDKNDETFRRFRRVGSRR